LLSKAPEIIPFFPFKRLFDINFYLGIAMLEK
jgi:hypothetical protein